MAPSPLEVSRQSGLSATTGTFGGSRRFVAKLGRGAHSPDGEHFYGRNQIHKRLDELGVTCSLGVGVRKEMTTPSAAGKNVGPGTYDIVASAAKSASPLDGADYCHMTIGKKLPSALVPADLCSPGPHHKYEVRKPLDHHCPKYAKPAMSRMGRHELAHDNHRAPGPGAYNQDYLSVTRSASCPASAKSSQIPPKQVTTKCTFGLADRFRGAKQTCSPQGEMYYAHSKFLTGDDYLKRSKSCTFGHGTKVDFANPLRTKLSDVSPVSYSPCTSIAYATSPLDGLVLRQPSPIASAVKGLAGRAPRSPGQQAAAASPAKARLSAAADVAASRQPSIVISNAGG